MMIRPLFALWLSVLPTFQRSKGFCHRPWGLAAAPAGVRRVPVTHRVLPVLLFPPWASYHWNSWLPSSLPPWGHLLTRVQPRGRRNPIHGSRGPVGNDFGLGGLPI